MNLSKQIKKHRETRSLSQEELAEKIYVSRQTISNWENERSYPDIHNLLLLSVLFETSLDELVKGDVDEMKQTVKRSKVNKDSVKMLIWLVVTVLFAGPLMYYVGWTGLILAGIFWLIAMYYAFKIERWKKREDIKNYREIVAFMENGNVEKVRAKRNPKKDAWVKLGWVLLFALGGAFFAYVSIWFVSLFL